MSTEVKAPEFKVPNATSAGEPHTPTAAETEGKAGPHIERPFTEGCLHGLSDAELAAVLTAEDLIDAQRSYNVEQIASFFNLSERVVLAVLNEKDKHGYVIRDVRGRDDYHPTVFGYRILEWLETHPSVSGQPVKADPDAWALRCYRSRHPEFFADPPGEQNLVQRMRSERRRIETEAAAEERRRQQEAYLHEKFGRVGEILSRYHNPTDGDVVEMVGLSTELGLLESDIARLLHVIRTAARLQERIDEGTAGNPRRTEEAIAALRDLAGKNRGLFDESGPFPRLKFPAPSA